MTELSREILRDWQIRKTKAQKLRFIEFMQSRLPGLAVEDFKMLKNHIQDNKTKYCRNPIYF